MKDLVNAFAQRPQLPKMLNRKAILDTLVSGCVDGTFVLRLTRPDKSVKTFWRQTPDDVALKDPGLEVVLPGAATLSDIPTALLSPQILPRLWNQPAIAVKDVVDYFSGGKVIQVPRDGYEEPVVIPKVERSVVEQAMQCAVKEGRLWLTIGPASIFAEEIPVGLLNDDAQLQRPPDAISPMALVPDVLSEAWSGSATTALVLSVGLSKKAGKALPWATVKDAIDAALRSRILERTESSGGWPCDYASAKTVILRVPQQQTLPPSPQPTPAPRAGVRIARAELRPNQIQDLADQISEITRVAAGLDLKFRIEVELDGSGTNATDVIEKLNAMLTSIAKDLKLD